MLRSTPKEVAIVGSNPNDIQPLIGEAWRRYLPNKVVAASYGIDLLPLWEGRTMLNGRPTAYVCEHYTCKQPVTDVDELASQLT